MKPYTLQRIALALYALAYLSACQKPTPAAPAPVVAIQEPYTVPSEAPSPEPSAEPTPVPSPSPTPPWNQTPEHEWGAPVDTALPNVRVLGDSISVGYTDALYDILKDEYDVMHPQDNCRNTVYTLERLDQWTSSADAIVVWNNGLWDQVRPEWYDEYMASTGMPREWYTQTDAEYEANLITIATKLKANGSRVLFMTTTDVQYFASGTFTYQRELVLNDIAKRVLPPLGVEVLDLNAFALTIPDAHPSIWEVHFEKSASKLMAEYIAKAIRGQL